MGRGLDVKHIAKNRVNVSISARRGRGAAGAEGCGEEYPPPHWGKGLGRGLCPLGLSPEIFSYFLAKIPYFYAF